MNKDNRLAIARKLGGKAFESKMKRIPVLDTELTELLTGTSHELRCDLMKEWYKGWDISNLRELVVFLDLEIEKPVKGILGTYNEIVQTHQNQLRQVSTSYTDFSSFSMALKVFRMLEKKYSHLSLEVEGRKIKITIWHN
jgi:hypothetical protein